MTPGDQLYVPEPTTFRLQFEDPRMAGPPPLEIVVRSMSLGEWMELTSDAAWVEAFASHLVSWNLGRPASKGKQVKVPATREGLFTQEPWWVVKVVKTWKNAVRGTPDPLGQPSSNGDRELEASLPMDSL